MSFDLRHLNAPLKALDNQTVRIGIIIALIVIGAGIVPMLNNTILGLLTNPVIKVVVLLLIVYIAQKDLTISLLLAVVYVLMLNLVREHMSGLSMDMGPDDKEAAPVDYNLGNGAMPPSNDERKKAAILAGMNVGNQGVSGVNPKLHQEAGPGFRDQQQVQENMWAAAQRAGPLGFNTEINCVGRGHTGGDLTAPCSGFGVFRPDLNAQGMNQVLGNPGDVDGAPF